MARKGENIYRRKDGRWEGRYVKTRCPDGRIKYGSVYGRTYAEAKKKLLEKHTELFLLAREQPQEENLPSGCFGLVARQWLASARKDIKQSTFNKYTDLLEKHILPSLGKMEMMAVTEQALEKLSAEKLEKGRLNRSGGLSPKTVADMLSVIKQVFLYAKLAVPSVRLKSAPRKIGTFSRYEQQCLIATLLREMDLYKLGTLLCLHTGLHVGELCALTWRDIDLRENILHVRSTMQRLRDHAPSAAAKTKIVVGAPKSHCSLRDIPLPETLASLLRKFAQDQNPDAYFLSGSKSIVVEPRAMQYRFRSYLKQSGISALPFHALRHTFASNWVEKGLEVKCLSQILGHSSIKITLDRYMHTPMELKRDQMEQMGNLFAPESSVTISDSKRISRQSLP